MLLIELCITIGSAKGSQKRDFDLYACAGIAVVKTHYPFARAYELSQSLTESAKSYAREEADGNLSALDWHFAAGGLLGKLKKTRDALFPSQILAKLCLSQSVEHKPYQNLTE